MTDNKMTAEQALLALDELDVAIPRRGVNNYYDELFAKLRAHLTDPGYVRVPAEQIWRDVDGIERRIACNEIAPAAAFTLMKQLISQALSAPRVPHGWRIVPYKFSEEMFEAAASFGGSGGYSWLRGRTCEDAWPHILSVFDDAMLTASPEPVAPAQAEQLCKHCGGKTMHVGDVCYSCSHQPEPVAASEKVHAVSLAPEVPGSDKRGVIGHYKIHQNGDREGTVLGNWDWERVVADAGLTGKWMVLHFTDAADFERDWSMLEATQDSLREHSDLLKQRDSELDDLRAEVEALRKDAERLDWLDQDKMAFVERSFHWNNDFNGVRDAIDAARLREGVE